jgi:hypothetical protein
MVRMKKNVADFRKRKSSFGVANKTIVAKAATQIRREGNNLSGAIPIVMASELSVVASMRVAIFE